MYFGLLQKVKRMQTEGEAAFIDAKGYVRTVDAAQADFATIIAAQAAAADVLTR